APLGRRPSTQASSPERRCVWIPGGLYEAWLRHDAGMTVVERQRELRGLPVFDIKWIRDNAEAFDAGLKSRGLEPAAAKLLELDDARRRHLTKLQEAQSRRNAASKEIGKA